MALSKLPKGVVALGLVSLFMDLSSEMISEQRCWRHLRKKSV